MDSNTPSVHTDGPPPLAAREIVLDIGGMHCDSCAALILETLAEEPAVSHVEVTRDPDEARVTFDDARVSVDDLTAVLEALGYTASLR